MSPKDNYLRHAKTTKRMTITYESYEPDKSDESGESDVTHIGECRTLICYRISER